MGMLLSTLLQGIEYRVISGSLQNRISSVEYDSRKITEGGVFVAIKGFTSDGHDYIEQALQNGALCVVVEKNREGYLDDQLKQMCKSDEISVIEVNSGRVALAELSAALFGHPEDRLDLVGVTGTKGKTTTTFMIHEILKRDDHGSGLIGTVCNMIGDEKRHSEHTTPESHELYMLLEELAEKNFDSCVMEVSSQGLKLDRVYGLRFDVAAFTNLYEDHISENEHPDMEDYLNCKLKIFDSSRLAVVNSDCQVASEVIKYARSKCPVFTYGLTDKSDCYASNIRKDKVNGLTGSTFDLVSPWYVGEVFVSIPGEFNVYNALCAICVAGLLKVKFENVKSALATVFVPGRLQHVENKLDVSVLVDYAHNAASLENVLKTLRSYTSGRLITVFGCGGNRAKTRRYEMGEISGLFSDYTVITSDNPRKENPSDIIDDILKGISKTDGKYEIVVDRASAIEAAIKMAKSGDTVLIAGKGHEDYQIFEDRTIHFDDCEVASQVITELEAANK